MIALLVAAAALATPCGGGVSECDCACVVGAHGVPEFSRRFMARKPSCGDHATQAIDPGVVQRCGGAESVVAQILTCTGNRAFSPQCYAHGSAAVELVVWGTATAVALWLPVVHAASSL